MALVVPVAKIGVIEADADDEGHDAEIDEGQERVDGGRALDSQSQEEGVEEAKTGGHRVRVVAQRLVHAVAGHQALRKVADRPARERVDVAAPGSRHRCCTCVL